MMNDLFLPDKKKSSSFVRLYKGQYHYLSGGKAYTEEMFEVYKDKSELTLHFDAEIISRVTTGELLKISTSYVVTKEWLPKIALVQKSLGNKLVQETYDVNSKANTLDYHYHSQDEDHECTFNTPPKFHIAIPAACSALCFIAAKKIDQTAKNYYYGYHSVNDWKYQGRPIARNLVLMRTNIGEQEEIRINGSNLSAIKYKLYFENSETSKIDTKSKGKKAEGVSKGQDMLTIFLSKHHQIPYLIRSNLDTTIEIKFLNNFDDETEIPFEKI